MEEMKDYQHFSKHPSKRGCYPSFSGQWSISGRRKDLVALSSSSASFSRFCSSLFPFVHHSHCPPLTESPSFRSNQSSRHRNCHPNRPPSSSPSDSLSCIKLPSRLRYPGCYYSASSSLTSLTSLTRSTCCILLIISTIVLLLLHNSVSASHLSNSSLSIPITIANVAPATAVGIQSGKRQLSTSSLASSLPGANPVSSSSSSSSASSSATKYFYANDKLDDDQVNSYVNRRLSSGSSSSSWTSLSANNLSTQSGHNSQRAASPSASSLLPPLNRLSSNSANLLPTLSSSLSSSRPSSAVFPASLSTGNVRFGSASSLSSSSSAWSPTSSSSVGHSQPYHNSSNHYSPYSPSLYNHNTNYLSQPELSSSVSSSQFGPSFVAKRQQQTNKHSMSPSGATYSHNNNTGKHLKPNFDHLDPGSWVQPVYVSSSSLAPVSTTATNQTSNFQFSIESNNNKDSGIRVNAQIAPEFISNQNNNSTSLGNFQSISSSSNNNNNIFESNNHSIVTNSKNLAKISNSVHSILSSSNITHNVNTRRESTSMSNMKFSLRDEQWVAPIIALSLLNMMFIIGFEGFVIYRACRTSPSRRHLFLGQMLLLGLFLSSAMGIAFVPTANWLSCTMIRAGVGICYSIVYATLLVKTVFLLSLHTGVYLSAEYQALLLFFIISTQVAIDSQWLIHRSSSTVIDYMDGFGHAVYKCDHSVNQLLLSLVYVMVLIVLVAVMAFRVRGYRENHGEALFVGIAAICTVVLWLVWIAGTITSTPHYRDGFVAFGVVGNATLTFVIMFLPKGRQMAAVGREGHSDDRDQLSTASSPSIYTPSFLHIKPVNQLIPLGKPLGALGSVGGAPGVIGGYQSNYHLYKQFQGTGTTVTSPTGTTGPLPSMPNSFSSHAIFNCPPPPVPHKEQHHRRSSGANNNEDDDPNYSNLSNIFTNTTGASTNNHRSGDAVGGGGSSNLSSPDNSDKLLQNSSSADSGSSRHSNSTGSGNSSRNNSAISSSTGKQSKASSSQKNNNNNKSSSSQHHHHHHHIKPGNNSPSHPRQQLQPPNNNNNSSSSSSKNAGFFYLQPPPLPTPITSTSSQQQQQNNRAPWRQTCYTANYGASSGLHRAIHSHGHSMANHHSHLNGNQNNSNGGGNGSQPSHHYPKTVNYHNSSSAFYPGGATIGQIGSLGIAAGNNMLNNNSANNQVTTPLGPPPSIHPLLSPTSDTEATSFYFASFDAAGSVTRQLMAGNGMIGVPNGSSNNHGGNGGPNGNNSSNNGHISNFNKYFRGQHY